MANVFYNRIIRKLVVGFGNLFNDITLVRYNPDLTEQERFIIPISYASKELYVQRLEGDPDLEKKVQITLPRFSFEMVGLSYDATRKQNTNVKNFTQTATGTKSQYNPVPYNFDFNLYLYVRNIEDATQVLEHVLSYFTPDYTIKLNLIPEMGIVKEVPVVLNNTQQEIQYEGNRDSDTRLIIWTLNFTVKGFVYGPIKSTNLISSSITNFLPLISPETQIQFVMDPTSGVGNYMLGETVYQGYSTGTATALGTVVDWHANNLTLQGITGNFVSDLPVIGVTTNASYKYTSYNVLGGAIAIPKVTVSVTPNPLSANASSPHTSNVSVTTTPSSP